MAMMIYTTGNGYRCGCCRRTSQDYTHFDEADIDSLIEECISISSDSDDDFSINTFEGYSGDADELETRIMAAISDAEKYREHKRAIEVLQRNIKEIDSWFNTLDQTKASKIERRAELQSKLDALEAK